MMPAMVRPRGKATKIAYQLLETPPALRSHYKRLKASAQVSGARDNKLDAQQQQALLYHDSFNQR